MSKCVAVNQIIQMRKAPKTPHPGLEMILEPGLGIRAALSNFSTLSAVSDAHSQLNEIVAQRSMAGAVDSDVRINVGGGTFSSLQSVVARLDTLFPPLVHIDG